MGESSQNATHGSQRKKTTNQRVRLIRRTLIGGLGVTVLAVLAILLPRWLSQRDSYIPGQSVEGITQDLTRGPREERAPFRFTDVTAEAGIDFHHFPDRRTTQLPEDMGSGVAWGDYDGDGDSDLYLVNIAGSLRRSPEELEASSAHNVLMRNRGDGSFEDATAEAGVGCRIIGMGAVWGDVNADGRLDLFTTAYGRNYLYLNEDGRCFRDATVDAGLDEEGFWTGCGFADYDNDGDLDLYVGGYVHYAFDPADTLKSSDAYEAVLPYTLNPSSYKPHHNRLYRNDGTGRFTDVAAEAGVLNEQGRSLSISWSDFDMDGWQDIYIANDVSDNVMYRNLGDGHFEDVSHEAWVADYRGAMGLSVEDWDGDGDLDIFVTHWVAQENAFYRNLYEDTPGAMERAARFVDEADALGLGQIALDYIGWGNMLKDFDADGQLDLLVVNGSTFPQSERPWLLEPMEDLLFWNRGNEVGFFEVGASAAPHFEKMESSRGAAAADYDGDGDLDVLIMGFGAPAVLLRNDAPQGDWLRVRVKGPNDAPYCPNAMVRVKADGRNWVAQSGASVSYLSQHEPTFHFGMGECAVADTVEVIRPGREAIVVLDVPTGDVLEIAWDTDG